MLQELVVFLTVDVDDHGVAVNAGVRDLLGLPCKTTLRHVLRMLFGHADADRLRTDAPAFRKHAHWVATK